MRVSHESHGRASPAGLRGDDEHAACDVPRAVAHGRAVEVPMSDEIDLEFRPSWQSQIAGATRRRSHEPVGLFHADDLTLMAKPSDGPSGGS